MYLMYMQLRVESGFKKAVLCGSLCPKTDCSELPMNFTG